MNHCPMDPQLNECQIAVDLRARVVELEAASVESAKRWEKILNTVRHERDRYRKAMERIDTDHGMDRAACAVYAAETLRNDYNYFDPPE